MTETAEGAAAPATDAKTERQVRRLARNISRFAGRHAVDGNAQADAVVEYVGRDSTRIVLVGADGEWGDQVARNPQIARRAVEAAGLTLHDEFPNDVALRVKTGPYEWNRMAGLQLGSPAGA
ncbi:hypothetical protein ACPA54_20190 [Uniformispora flossi]|uniref:hypothetical protein n=1 Tax=Uniformispora flossi TaxID=3390723 RepID=UPI003C2DCDFF